MSIRTGNYSHFHLIMFKRHVVSESDYRNKDINNPNFEKPFRNPSNRTQVFLNKNFGYHSKKFGSAYAQSPRKCLNFKILAKIKGKEAKFFSKIYQWHIRICFRQKKYSKLSHACVPLIINQTHKCFQDYYYY
jgi:hypothetical protein